MYLKNTTGGDLKYTGRVIPAGGQRDGTKGNEILRESDELLAAIDAGDIVVNDGTDDLSAEKGKAHLFLPVFGDVDHEFYVSVDRQQAVASAEVKTTTKTHIDLDSMTLTTKDLGGDGNYIISFTCGYKHQGDDKDCHFCINVDGVEVATVAAVGYKRNKWGEFSITHQESGVTAGTVIKIQVFQASTDTKKDELTIGTRRLVIDGLKEYFVL